jgi:uncharacterized membrane protein YhaH (DUF805 family)
MDFNKLWTNFMDAVQNHYMDFAGRVGRAQYWYFILVYIAVVVVASVVDAVVTHGLLAGVIGLALLLPVGGMSARRVQDTGRSGQLVWVWVIAAIVYNALMLLTVLSGPLGAVFLLAFFFTIGWLINLAFAVATIAIIYFCAQPGQAEANAYGPVPPVWTPN